MTTDTDRCALTELLRRECAHCRGHDQTSWLARLRAHLLTLPGWLVAAYPGTCCECGEPYSPGAAIHVRRGGSHADGSRRWMAECCTDEEIPDPSPLPTINPVTGGDLHESTLDNSEQPEPSTHECPAPGCKRSVRRHLYACGPDWRRLPFSLRQAISSAYGRDLAAHVAAMAEAAQWYARHAGVRT